MYTDSFTLTIRQRHTLQKNMGWVHELAWRLWRRLPESGQRRLGTIHELVSAGTVGLAVAIHSYDPGRDIRLTTYSTWWIKQQMYATVGRAYVIRAPLGVLQYLRNGKVPKNETKEVMDRLAEKARRAIGALSLSAFYGDGKRPDLEPDGGRHVREAEPYGIDAVRAEIKRLSPMHRRVIAMRLGLDGRRPMRFSAIGRRCGITRQAAQTRYTVAIRELRRRLTHEQPALGSGCEARPAGNRDPAGPFTGVA